MSAAGAESDPFDPAEFSAHHKEAALRLGVALFNDGEYHAAHEAFEQCWLANEGGDSDFYKGLIQAAICLHHWTDGNDEGARKLHAGCRRLLAPYLPVHERLDLSSFLGEMQQCLSSGADGSRGCSNGKRPSLSQALAED